MLQTKIIEKHIPSFKGILNIISHRNTLKKLPFLITFILTALFLFIIPNKLNYILNCLSHLTEITLNVFPDLLGFSLGGYALIVGFNNTELIKKTSKIDDYSTYQVLSAIFALSVIIQVFSTLLAFLIKFLFDNAYLIKQIVTNDFCLIFISYAMLFTLMLSVLYSLILTPYIVVNLFTLSQIVNMNHTIEQYQDDHKKEKK